MCVNCGVSSCSSCNTNSYIPDSTSALKYDGSKFVCPTNFTVLPGAPLNDVLNTLMQQICTNSSGFTHYLGEEFEGGIIYYLWKDSLGVERGLIVNKGEGTEVWQSVGTITGANRDEDGAYNTALMTNSDAADYVNALTDGGFTDWYLPAIDELVLLFNNRFHVQEILRTGSFPLLKNIQAYSSSTEYNTGAAFFFDLDGSGVAYGNKTTPYKIRGIRKF